ncbi:FAD binding domain-containing protein [Pengzhenrongella sicca]|uniref:FAD binding domain-containing protein n=1 Tax=Pengzhenrongella sicca TaxID=2819238 RepID=A0A8A4ZBG5_9MICO|nr:FAD binding domain-containing protein [Pengzhenrongella sicca]QTE28223.1 FAD binding domain-containing protein [Pengzhenrongella sicca]
MDLVSVRTTRVPRSRAELTFSAGDLPLGGGTWLFSEPQPGVTGLVDLTGLGWPAITATPDALVVAATCTLEDLARVPAAQCGAARELIWRCCTALLGSYKIWHTATVGGNICLALPAGPMTSLAVALDAQAVTWPAGGGERRLPVADLVVDVRACDLAPGEVLRAIEIPAASLAARTGFRRLALSPLGRSGTLVIARADAAGEFVVTVTAGTRRPHQLRFDEVPPARALESAVLRLDDWYDDAHGAPDWRRAMTALLAEELRVELGGAA